MGGVRGRAAPAGAVVSLYVDLERTVNLGDIIETRSGRGYLVVGARVQQRGAHAGRQHLKCDVLPAGWSEDLDGAWRVGTRPDSYVHRIRWYRRQRGAGVVKRT
jgi:hypothetical protein